MNEREICSWGTKTKIAAQDGQEKGLKRDLFSFMRTVDSLNVAVYFLAGTAGGAMGAFGATGGVGGAIGASAL